MRRILEYKAPAWVGGVGFASCVVSLTTILFTDASLWLLGSLGFLMTAASFDLTDTDAVADPERDGP